MNLFDRTVLDVAGIMFSLFFLVALVFIVYVWVSYHRMLKKAVLALDSVESVGRMIKEVGTKSSASVVLKFLKFIFSASRKN